MKTRIKVCKQINEHCKTIKQVCNNTERFKKELHNTNKWLQGKIDNYDNNIDIFLHHSVLKYVNKSTSLIIQTWSKQLHCISPFLKKMLYNNT